jgi:hypothetical protein
MEKQDVTFVRFTASKGKVLKWRSKYFNYFTNKLDVITTYSVQSEILALCDIVGDVEEISYEEYEESLKVEYLKH